LERLTHIHGAENLETLRSGHNLALTIARQGDTATARSMLLSILDVQFQVLGTTHPETLRTQANLEKMNKSSD